MCGDWPRADIFARWPRDIALELCSFAWPLITLDEVCRFFRCRHAAPQNIAGCEFTRAEAEAVELAHQEITVSVDPRHALKPGAHICMDLRAVLYLKRWKRALLFPPCTHQTLSDTTAREAKQLDGRMFWGILFVIWCYCAPATMLLVEQPDTVIPDFFIQPSQRFKTSELGDEDNKTINLYERRRMRLTLQQAPGGVSGHGKLHDFIDADDRDRWRSSWDRFPCTARAVAEAPHDPLDVAPDPVFEEARELFAIEWHQRGLPVPHDYENDNALPTGSDQQTYQFTRGGGDGRRLLSVIPRSLRDATGLAVIEPASNELERVVGHEVDLRILTEHAIFLCFIAMQTVPLIYAALNGFTVLGAELHTPTQRSLGLTLATRWAEAAISTTSSTFLVGEYDEGARLFAAPLNIAVRHRDVVRTPTERRRRLLSGCAFAWCTLAALVGCVAHDPAARAVAACTAMRSPVYHLADDILLGHAKLSGFTFGVSAMRPMVDRPRDLPFASTPAEHALAVAWRDARMLRERCELEGKTDSDLLDWAQVIRPPQLQDIPAELFHSIPCFDDIRLDSLAFHPDYSPPHLPKLLPRPPQPERDFEGACACPRSAFDLMPDTTSRRLHAWLYKALDDLVCMRDLGVDCDRDRPPFLVIAQSQLHECARGFIWDFRKSPKECGRPLDYGEPLQPTLKAGFFTKELADYPNQRIVGMIETGVIYMADVELHATFAPHLVSLPKGFKAVAKEMRRLSAKGWYDFFHTIPFFPGYYNAQGSTARKLEPDRDRRTTEGGAPRKDTWDKDGLKVLSINEASKVHHMPQYFKEDQRPVFLQWLETRGLPWNPPEEGTHAPPSKWASQVMPTIKQLARNLAVLKRAAYLLGEPLYLFGDDIKDFFNHLENAISELPLMNVVFLGADGDLSAELQRSALQDSGGNTLVFISERRMGFGIHPNSGIAQELSESIDHVFRRRMDAVEDPIAENDVRPSMQNWLASRRKLEHKVGGHQRRLYTSLTFCDDSIIGVVGVDRAMRAIRTRRDITHESGLIMAIWEKRTLGVWGVWLGIALFVCLGLVIVPRDKLARASQAVLSAVNGQLCFDEYRSLTGLLEHIRHACVWPRRIMHGLYHPHGPDGDGRGGPSAIVRPNFFMVAQLHHWVALLSTLAGSAFTSMLNRAHLPAQLGGLTYFASSDAATDSTPPGLDGYMHGLYWYLALTAEHIKWLHITVLELLASGFSAIVFHRAIGPTAELALGADAMATPATLADETESSAMLMAAHHELLDSSTFTDAASRSSIGHLRGDSNLASDAVSRSLWAKFHLLCRQLRVRPRELAVPQECLDILQRVLDHARARNIPIRPNPYKSEPTVVPPSYSRYLPVAAHRAHENQRRDEAYRHEVRSRSSSPHSSQDLLCPRCGEVLPLELSGRGRCPSCTDYDGPSVAPLAAFDDFMPLELVEYIARLLYPDSPFDALLFLSARKSYRVCLRRLNYAVLVLHCRLRSQLHHPTLSTRGAPMAFGLERSFVLNAWTTSTWSGRREGRFTEVIPWASLWTLGSLNRVFWFAFLEVYEGNFRPRLRFDYIYLTGHGQLALESVWLGLERLELPECYQFEVLDSEKVRRRALRLKRDCNEADHLTVKAKITLTGIRLTLVLAIEYKLLLVEASPEERLGPYPDVREWNFQVFQTSITSITVEQFSTGVLHLSSYLGKMFSSNTDGDGPFSFADAERLLQSYDRCLELPWLNKVDVESHMRDESTCSLLRSLLTCLGCENAKLPSFKALGAVLAQAAHPEIFTIDRHAYDTFGASRSNFKHYRRRLTALLTAAAQTFELPPEATGRGRCPSSTEYDGPNRDDTEPKRSRFFQSHHPGSSQPPVSPFVAPSEQPALKRSRFYASHHATASCPEPHRPPDRPFSSHPVRLPSALEGRVMPSTIVGGQRLAMPGARKARVVSMRKEAMLELAQRRASALAGEQATAEQRANLADAVVATHELADFGAAFTTLDADDHAWEFWERFCMTYGWQTTFTAEYARNHMAEISERLAIFQAWVYPQLRGRNGRADAKPRTAFNKYALAIIRILGREHVPMPKAKAIEKSLYGIMRTFKGIYGVEHLMPGRKQPMTPAIWDKIQALPEGQRLGSRRALWSPLTQWRDRILLRLGRVLWRTGHRLGEIVAHPSGEINFITRSSVSIRKANGVHLAVPTAADWRNLAPGDVVHLAPCASKADQFGERHCPFPSVLPHDGSDSSAAAAIRDIELEQPCAPSLRKCTALFSNGDGQPFTYAILHAELRHLLTAVVGERAAQAYSWHAFRIGLACALHAADCPDPVIQLICRWSCPESLQVYRQMGIDKNVFWTEKAQHVTFDAVRVNNLPALDDADERLQRGDFNAADLDDAAQAPRTPERTPERLIQTMIIPNGTVRVYTSDSAGLIGLIAHVPRSFWTVHDQLASPNRSFPCKVVGESVREFLHADGTRSTAMLIEHHDQLFPIKRSDLVANCITREQRSSLRL